ncbi:helix-turn-helix domain-containing protein [Cytophagaceae bacterium ABcell3]|nr:helix-turn-helix domain-containing protein [Cytophagaceae bacterium ABcell3]
MKHISLLLPYGLNVAGMDNARQGFLEANNYLVDRGKKPAFKLELIGASHQLEAQQGVFMIKADRTLADLEHTDIIIIPPVKGYMPDILQNNTPYYPWITNQYQKGAEVVSICLGAFLLAQTGLLNGKKCATHWHATTELQRLFPKVSVMTDKILTDENRIYTGGGAFSSANLILYLIEKFSNRETAVYCSKIFQIDPGRHTQSPFAIFSGQKDHGDKEIEKAQEFIERNAEEKISINELCDNVALARRTLERRFKKATSNTVTEYIQRVKVETAKKHLEGGIKTVNEVMFDVGYSDTKSFREIFRKHTGVTPLEYKNRYRKPRLK